MDHLLLDLFTARYAVWFAALVNASLKGLLIFATAVLAARLLGRASAAKRHAIWLLALAGLGAFPLLSHIVPAWQPHWLSISLARFAPAAPSGALRPGAVAGAGSFLHGFAVRVLQFDWLGAGAMLWLLLAAFLLIRFGRSYLRLAGVLRRAKPIDDAGWQTLLGELCARMGIRRAVRLLMSAEIETPISAGALRPAVLLPPDFGEWPEERRQGVLLHELAHVRRFDAPLQIAAHVLCIVYWFNPLVWLAARALRDECERACDDYALMGGVKASEYARHLLELSSLSAEPQAASIALALARRRRLHARLLAILDPRLSRGPLSQVAACAAVIAAIALVVPLAALRTPPPQTGMPPKMAITQRAAASLPRSAAAPLLASLTKRGAVAVAQKPSRARRPLGDSWLPEREAAREVARARHSIAPPARFFDQDGAPPPILVLYYFEVQVVPAAGDSAAGDGTQRPSSAPQLRYRQFERTFILLGI